ncbi:Sirohydrochlorin ferrochelatase [Arthrobacter alpinus]|uniref:Sirohydrochlorin ferrochelatase n=1 Tax=Arthrobacter alpinus TaxID=656366 RepID=A0A0U3PB80_9MICC|nr:CbiX/SirB N-terminal domain-containing protein [Arthrobacter alpinus]ALV46479.1 cobalamin biosynthesis protein CbiX [Arthrobacter alpinus]SEE99111.1 Sirohydrochlorin ferrochelatase [Arthrobacter alpinus]
MEHQTVMIACAHGTDNAQGQACINQLRADIGRLRPGLEVLEAYVDVQEPALPDVVAHLASGVRAVVVPLLLTVGYHVQVDIAQAVASRPNTLAAAPLGPDPRLAKLLDERLGELPADWGIVLAAAGSSRPEAAEQIEVLAADLAVRRPQRILAAYGASARPSVPEAVEQLRAAGAPGVAVSSYLLAPGFFHDQLALAGADQVAAPLLPSALLAELALEHFDRAISAASAAA